MGGYGYTYRSFSTYSTAKDESISGRGPVIRPFVPFVPTSNSNTEGYVTQKKIVPVASRPYDDDYSKHSSPTESYPARDDDGRHRQASPVHGRRPKAHDFLKKVQNEASRPARFSPVSSTDGYQSPQPTAYNGGNGYDGHGNYNSNEGHKKPAGSPIRNDSYDGYNNGANSYGDNGNYSKKEGHQPTGSPNYDGNGYGNYSNKEGYKAPGSPKTPNYDGNGYGNHSNKEGHKPPGSPNYDGTNGYGNYSNKAGQKPIASPIRNDNYYRHQPAGNYSVTEPNRTIPGGWTRPKISSAWTASPRKGTQLSEPTDDIEKAIALLKEAAKLTPNGHSAGVNGYGDDHSNKGLHKASGNASTNDNYDNYQRTHDGVDRLNPSIWAAPPRNNGSHFGEPASKVGKGTELVKEAERLKNNVTGHHPQSRTTVLIEAATPNEDDYGQTIDTRDPTRRYGNLNFSSQPRTSPTQFTTVDAIAREPDYRDNIIDSRDTTRRYGTASLPAVSTIDSREAEKKYRGRRI